MQSKKFNSKLTKITKRIIERSRSTRESYLLGLEDKYDSANKNNASCLGCSNIAHAFAASNDEDKLKQIDRIKGNLGIVTAYNDMLSAHQPYADYPDLIKSIAREQNGTAQVAGGVPAMCDGVTQGQPGMELSLFSRDVIAMSASVALSHNVFDGAVFLGICDKIVPGLSIAAATFGHLPSIFLPSGPMPSGIPNAEKNKVREDYASGKVTEDILLQTEMKSYHTSGTCTFYGTANTNQMLMEIMGLQLPGSSFVNPDTSLRDGLNRAGVQRLFKMMDTQDGFTPVSKILDVPNFVNGMVGLHATGGSTNLLLHMVVMARAAGIIINWQDFSDLAEFVPLIARVYPNGQADVNAFQQAGGMQFLISELLSHGLLNEEVVTVAGDGLSHYQYQPELDEDGVVIWEKLISDTSDKDILQTVNNAFQDTGGLKLINGNLGQAIVKSSALSEEQYFVEAPARVFTDQDSVKQAFEADELNMDFVCVVKQQGPKANGMPELHGLTPVLGVLQGKGYKVALVTDGRMSGASGKIPAAIHVCPEALSGGAISKIQDGDLIRLDIINGTLEVLEDLDSRELPEVSISTAHGFGRELFSSFRTSVGSADKGATILFP